MTTPLSPAAQAVIDAAWKGVPSGLRDPYIVRCEQCAAALRAAADQVVPEEREPYVPDYPDSDQIAPWHEWTERQHARAGLLAIATELEAQP